MRVIKTTSFKKDIDSIDQFIYGTIEQETWQDEPIVADGQEYIKHKPILDGWKEFQTYELFFDEETMAYHLKDTIKIGGDTYDTYWLSSTIKFVSKKAVNLNTAVDVTFTYDADNKEYTVRLSDWNVFRVMSDEECISELKKQLYIRDEI